MRRLSGPGSLTYLQHKFITSLVLLSSLIYFYSPFLQQLLYCSVRALSLFFLCQSPSTAQVYIPPHLFYFSQPPPPQTRQNLACLTHPSLVKNYTSLSSTFRRTHAIHTCVSLPPFGLSSFRFNCRLILTATDNKSRRTVKSQQSHFATLRRGEKARSSRTSREIGPSFKL